MACLSDAEIGDPKMESAAFGPPLVGADHHQTFEELNMVHVQGVTIEDCLIGDGFVVFYRRLPPEMRDRRRNPARRFDMRVRQLEAA